MDRTALKFSLLAVLASLVFGLVTSAMPFKLSQKDPVWGYGSDNQVYWDAAGNLLAGRGFMQSPGFMFAYLEPTTTYTYSTQRLPGYPLALAAVRFISRSNNPNGLAIWLFDLIMVFFNAYFIISIIKKIFPDVSPHWFWLVAVWPPFLTFSNGIGTDFITAFQLSGFAYFALKDSNGRWWALGFALWALFTRANALFFVLPFLLLLMLYKLKDRKTIIFGLATILAMAALFLGWSYRNQKLSGSFVYAPYTGQQLEQNYIRKVFRDQRPAGQERFYRWQVPGYLKQHFESLAAADGGNFYKAEVQLNNEITKDTIAWVLANKVTAVKVYIRDVVQVFTNEYYIFNLARTFGGPYVWAAAWTVAILLYTLPGMLMLLATAILLFKRTLNFSAILLYSSCAYVLLTASILGDFTRYVVPVGLGMVYGIIWAAYALKSKWGIISQMR